MTPLPTLCALIAVPLAAALVPRRAVTGRQSIDYSRYHTDIRKRVQAVLDEKSIQYNTSFSFGFADGEGSMSLVAGTNNIWTGEAMNPDVMIPSGSVTKSWTAAAVLLAQEKGLYSIDDLAATHVDPILLKLNQTTLQDLWGFEFASTVTLRHLLSMTSGLQDYNNTQAALMTLENPGTDISPLDYLHMVDKTLVCEIGTCASYSSIGYMLLGFSLVKAYDFESWEDLDQLNAVIPSELTGRYSHTSFPKKGPCKDYEGISNQYFGYSQVVYGKIFYTEFSDIIGDSCLNGWTCGNIAASGEDLAKYFFDIFNMRLIRNESLVEMYTPMRELVNDWCPGCYYGKGLIYVSNVFRTLDPSIDHHVVDIYGHAGQDWGSGTSPLCGGNTYYNFGICLGYNSGEGMNCSLPDVRNNRYMSYDVSCNAYAAVLEAIGGPALNCTIPQYTGLELYPYCEWKPAFPAPQREVAVRSHAEEGTLHF